VVQNKRLISPLAFVLILSGVFFGIFLLISGVFFLSQSPAGGRSASAPSRLFSTGSVGVIELNGVILDSKKTLSRLERFEEDDHIKAVVLRLNSPGGAVAPSQEIYEAVRNYKKPLVVSMGSVAASGAFYIACGAKKVFANPGTMTGSIGVIMEFLNLQKLYDWAKVNRYVVKSGKFKDMGSDFRPLTPEESTILKEMVEDVLHQFKQAIVTGRKLSLAQVSQVADGRIFSGSQAKALHLVDELGTIRDAIEEAAKQAKIKGKPTVIYSEKKKRGFLEYLIDDTPAGEGSEASVGETAKGWVRFLGTILNSSGEGSSLGVHPGPYFLWNGGRLE